MEEITLERAAELLQERRDKGPAKPKAASRKAAPRKAAPRKAAAGKSKAAGARKKKSA